MHINVSRPEISFRLNLIESDYSAYSTCMAIHEMRPNNTSSSDELKVSNEAFLAFLLSVG